MAPRKLIQVTDFQFVQVFPYKDMGDNFQTLYISELKLEVPQYVFFHIKHVHNYI